MKIIKRYPLNQSQLYKCHSKKRLAFLLKTDLTTLKKIARHPLYRSFPKKKKHSTGVRIINAPNDRLKAIQRSLYDRLKRVTRPTWLISGEMGKNWTDNGRLHVHSSYFTKIDISKFFDNCNREYVYQFFHKKLQQSPDVADICTSVVMVNGMIVQGAPTSMVIAYYSYETMFQELNTLAIENNLVFSVFVDDITFSSPKNFNIEHVKRRATQIIAAYGHKAKQKKVRSYGKKRVKKVTGTIISQSHQLRVPNQLQQSIINDFKKYKFQVKNQVPLIRLDKERRHLIGEVNSARQISPNIFPTVWRTLKEDSKSTV